MALEKQAININFQGGMDTKSDPFQLPIGKFINIVNATYDKTAGLVKRNGFGYLPPLPDSSSRFTTTYNGSLAAIGRDIKVLSPGPGLWLNKGPITPLDLSVLPLVRNNTNQSYVDTAISNNGLVCTTYTDNVPVGGVNQLQYKYTVADLISGQNVVYPTQITSTFGTVSTAPRVFTLGNYFVIVFGSTGSGSVTHLQYMSVSTVNPTTVGSVTDFSTSYTPSTTGNFDGVVSNNNLYLSWNGAAATGLRSGFLTGSFVKSSESVIASSSSTIVSVTADNSGTTPVIWSSIYVGSVSGIGSVVATGQTSGSGGSVQVGTLFSAKQFVVSSGSAYVVNIASVAQNGINQIYYEINNKYSYDAALATDYINLKTCNQVGSLSAEITVTRSVGLASKGFIVNSTSYFASTYTSSYQPTYFVHNSSGSIVSRFAYANGGGYLTTGLPSVTVTGSTSYFGYLIKNSISAVNKDTNVAAGTQVNGIYSQIGINLLTTTFGTPGLITSEIGGALHLNGGYLSMYDGITPVEHNFHLYPDNVEVTTTGSGGAVAAQTYFYQFTYEWADNNGNVFRSAPSIPVSIVVGSSTSTNTLNVPTLRLTAKTINPVKIVGYRWSTAQQTYYQFTSLTLPTLNNKGVDSVTITDTSSDATILGNNIIYTNGSVVEDIGGPAFKAITTFDTRLWGIDSEDPNLLWFSKQVIENTPVELSDLFTVFVSPNAGAQGPTGPMKCLAPMDNALIIFKKNALYYINGSGPDNTGANNQYSQATFITGIVGCSNQKSIIMTPHGLMFQSDKGIWILKRDLSTDYIGKDVQAYNDFEVVAALAIPDSNQVRFTLNNGITLMYDYIVGQWATFEGIPGISSVLYQELHTYINTNGQVFQETPGVYVDGSRPVVMSFTTGWINLAGVQGYQRAYWVTLLGTYYSPHRLTVGVAYDYDSSISQLATILPDNYSGVWGSGTSWGSISFWGGPSSREQWQVGFDRQQCQTFQLTLNEYYDPQFGIPAGAGLTLSGMAIVSGLKKGFPKDIPAANKTS